MIRPFAAPPGLVPRLDPLTAPGEAAPETRFADLLGDPGREIEVQAAADAIAASPNVPLGMASVGSGPEAALPGEAAAAERFNEHGFFGRAVPAFERTAGAVAPVAGEPVEAAARPAAEIPAPGDIDGIASGTTVPRRGALAKAAEMPAAPLRSTTHRGGTSGVVPQAAIGQPASALAGGGEIEDAHTAPSSGRRLLGAAAERAAQSAARVALSETGHGLHVAAFAQALPEEERSRLRDEIAALLSRHGLRPDRIHIAARRVPPASA